ncbi:glycoside hydrolase family 97 protein [Barnesiella sp. WM24]|uniref:glycoside hydrolase family 97 protein n=1 Tax=Barnesiella sp. WM24 TaxID=2558278 RepID=UPI00107295BD|nr:glycoside hydrolase family 97 protein [Barnesiella sp. WM24]TFU94087.1 glycoside hydrolase family 97 protein [Barnesiella sp. WM24]
MLKALLTPLLLSAPVTIVQAAVTVTGPDGKLAVTTDISDGKPQYTVTYDGKTVIGSSPLGFKSDVADFSSSMTITDTLRSSVDKRYTQDKIKHSDITYRANALAVTMKNVDGNEMTVEWQVSDNDVALRYAIPRQGETGAMIVNEESTGYRLPDDTRVFMTSQSDPMIGWKRTKPSYEEFYHVEAPLGTKSDYGHGFTFPALFHTPDGIWVLLTETDVDGYYCGSHLSDFHDGLYTIAYPMQEENNGNGTASPGIGLPHNTPWRTITIADNLAPIVETTIPWNLVEPRYETSRKAAPGRGTWSWIVWQDGSINFDDQKTYIDFAAEMGYENVLVDNWWDTNIGRDGIERLAAYAAGKGVNLIMWYSSSGHWNDIVQGPTGKMDRPIARKNEMKWLRETGIKAIKVDFFGGDKQETMRLYKDILSDAADYGIDVVFHGCTLPRGWERMYPNFVGSEAVLASENLIFGQNHCDLEAVSATLHPFIRNTAAIMEYGGTFLNRRLNRGNDGGTTRRTGDAFQLATSVLFHNPVQNFALTPGNLTDAPAEAIEFMKAVPTTWDETRYIDGYPGKYAVIARRNGDTWYVAGVNAMETPVTVCLPGFIGDNAKIYYDKTTDRMATRTVGKDRTVTIPSNCGFTAVSH